MSQIITDLFSGFYGKPCWNVKKGHGSFITFEFGEPSLEIGKIYETKLPYTFKHKNRPAHVHGEWNLWIYMCSWQILFKDESICHSESNDNEIQRACGFLNGQALDLVTVMPDGSTIFYFDLKGQLITMPYSDGELNNTWLLYCPEKKVFSLRSDYKYRFEHQDSGNKIYSDFT